MLTAHCPAPPLPQHIPLHHVVSNAEEGGRQLPPGSAASTASMMSPFGAAAAAQQGATPAAGQRPGGEGEQGRGRRDFLGRRPSTSSTVFYQGTPRNPLARRDRTRWLVERALGRSFVKGGGGHACWGRARLVPP